jgi:UDPglucose 6-dehydrogenase
MREAPALVIIDQLISLGANVKVFDPIAMQEAKNHYLGNKVEYSKDGYDACVDADALLLITEWSEFRMPSWDVLSKLMKQKIVFDGRNLYDRKYLEELGFVYHGIGV